MKPSKKPMSMASRMASVSLTRRCLDRRRAKTVLWRRTQVEGHSLQNCDVHQRFNSVRRLQYLPTRAGTVATTWADGTPVTPRGRLVHTLFFPSGAYIGLSICFLKGPLAEDQY